MMKFYYQGKNKTKNDVPVQNQSGGVSFESLFYPDFVVYTKCNRLYSVYVFKYEHHPEMLAQT